jgi:hypothetical protein
VYVKKIAFSQLGAPEASEKAKKAKKGSKKDHFQA